MEEKKNNKGNDPVFLVLIRGECLALSVSVQSSSQTPSYLILSLSLVLSESWRRRRTTRGMTLYSSSYQGQFSYTECPPLRHVEVYADLDAALESALL